MELRPDDCERLLRRTLTIANILCLVTLLFTLLTAIGWIFTIPLLTHGHPALPAMQPNTALGLALGAIAALFTPDFRRHRKSSLIACFLAWALLLFGLLTLSEYIFGLDLWIDHLFNTEIATKNQPYPGRPSPQASAGFALVGASLLVFNSRVILLMVGQFFALAGGLNALVAMTGYIFYTSHWGFPSYAPSIGMAIHTAIGFILLTVAILCRRPNEGIMTLITSRTRSGRMARKILIACVMAPLVIGALTRIGVLAGWYDVGAQISLFTLLMVGLILRVTWKAARQSEQEELRARDAFQASERANETLRKVLAERQIFSAFIENSSDFIGIADPNGKPIYINPGGRRMVGLPLDYAIENISISDFYPPECRSFVSSVMDKSIVERGHWQGETYFRDWQTHKPIPVSNTRFLIREPETQQVLGMGTITRNISDIKRAQDQVRQSQERLDLALRGADIGTWDWNIKTGEVIFNARWAEMRGYTLEEVQSNVNSWTSGIHPEDSPRVQKTLRDYLQGQIAEYETEFRVKTRLGKWIWIVDRGRIFARDQDGHPLRMAGTELDITERKRVEDELKFLLEVGQVLASTLEYEETLKNIAQLAVRDLADLCVIDIVDEDDEIRRWKVVSRELSKDWLCNLLMRTPFNQERPQIIFAVLKNKQSVLIEHISNDVIRSLAQNEEQFQALHTAEIKSVMVIPLLVHEKVMGLITLATFASSRVYDPARLRLAQELAYRAAISIENARLYRKAQFAIKTREDVLAFVSHDLKNPLTAIGLISQLLQKTNRVDVKQLAELASKIQGSVNQMQRLIGDLMDFAKIQSGAFSVEKYAENLNQVLMSIISSIRIQTEAKRQNLEVEVSPDLPEVACDFSRIGQVLANLLGNAIKFTPEYGSIHVSAHQQGIWIVVSVVDTGSGIPPEYLSKIFDRFWQAEKAKHMGSGLGLSIAKGIVQAHGGNIWCESQLGQGSSFFFSIPLATQETKRQSRGPG
jgi:PAS domain S-box-containing protein